MTTEYQLSDIEDYFNEQRAKARWPFKRLDPTDWHYMSAWQKDGIPFPVICRGIEEVFTNHIRRQAQGRINTVRYCEHAIKQHWKDHVAAHVGGGDVTSGHQADFGTDRVTAQLREWHDLLATIAWNHGQAGETVFADSLSAIAAQIESLATEFEYQTNLEALDASLLTLEDNLMALFTRHIGETAITKLTAAAEEYLKHYKDRMLPGLWQDTVTKAVHKKIREEFDIPRLSLFYL